MFQYILLIFCSKHDQGKNFEPLYEQKPNCNSNVKISCVNIIDISITAKSLKEQALPSQREKPTQSEAKIKKHELNYLQELLGFVYLMETNYLNTKTIKTNEKLLTCYLRFVTFDNLFRIWINEHHQVSINEVKVFPKDIWKKYRKCCMIINKFSHNIKRLNDVFLPTIKSEVESSSIDTISKSLIIENIDIISSTISYFAKLKPTYLKYNYNTDTMILYHRLSLERFPYLFDYFNLCKRFINLYELIIKRYIIFSSNHCIINQLLYDMSINLTYVFKKDMNF
ncbi:uncharacterized protein VNE69_12202 [Vairimorpha necatrix]|uniref:Uncharacterized protein n=1 Tax=Vairimorpha necatrix TaxID=6039 RepID=A0AAX4JHP2_9MICR